MSIDGPLHKQQYLDLKLYQWHSLSLGQRVRRLRLEAGKTQKWLSEQCRIALSYVCYLEHDARPNVSVAVVRRLAKAFGVSCGYLLD